MLNRLRSIRSFNMRFFTSVQLVAIMLAIGSSRFAIDAEAMRDHAIANVQLVNDNQLGDIE